jgi:hypothetical protein
LVVSFAPVVPTAGHPGDVPAAEFRAAMHQAADLVADYLEHVGNYPVLPRIVPGAVRAALPASPPEHAEPLQRLLGDYQQLIEPNVTHWNHPGFMAYFGITGSGPGILGELLSAGLNVNGMLWRTSPAATELELEVLQWLRRALELPDDFFGFLTDTASVSSMLGLAAAREAAGLDIRQRGMSGRSDLPPLRVYASDQSHSSIAKACVALGLGLDGYRSIPHDAEYRMDTAALTAAIAADRRAGLRPLAVVATVGTTSTTSVDPVPEIARICTAEGLWLHVDAAYAGSAALCPELRWALDGCELADSFVFNPHKWMFTPIDCSALYTRHRELFRRAFSLVPGVPDHAAGWQRTRDRPHGLWRPARAPLPAPQAVVGAALLGPRASASGSAPTSGSPRALPRSSTASRPSSGWPRCRSRSLPREPAGSRAPIPTASTCACSSASTPPARSFSRTPGSTAASRCASRSATSAPPRPMSALPELLVDGVGSAG